MDRAELTLNNRAPMRQIAAALLLLLAGIILAWFCSAMAADHLMTEQIRAMLGVLGGAPFADAGLHENAIALGTEQVAHMGVSVEMSPRLMVQWEPLRLQLFMGMLLLIALPAICLTICSIRYALRDYHRLEQLRTLCLSIRDGKTIAEQEIETDSIGRLAEGVLLIERQMRHMRAKLQSEKQALAEFLTDLSHQLKTVLAVIRLNSDLLAEPAMLSEGERTQLSEEMTMQLSQMEDLLRLSLKLAKLDAGAVVYHMQPRSLLLTCRETEMSIAPLLRAEGISMAVSAPSQQDIMLLHDAVWMREALENLIKNAVDHSGCTHIHMEIQQTPIFTKLMLRDNGKGIPQEEIPRLFDRFGKRSNCNDMKSVGIGLAIARQIIVSHGGEISVFSEPGQGTRFELIFLSGNC